MGLNIKNDEVERLVEEVAGMTGESKTEAVRMALLERRRRLRLDRVEGLRTDRLEDFLAHEIWPRVPADQLGRIPSKAEREEILGYGGDGI
ncbi:MAG: type II toxin-antitoxin system VapB family antitoxin [Gemmatimonadetes bacterium]|nr:type II toxin-antitoxin system VapB family antitoxin [Gemmatimonadota bacterium]